MKDAADYQFPPWPRARVSLSDYANDPEAAGDIATAMAFIGLATARVCDAAGLVRQAMTSLSTDAHGEPREPSLNEREALEYLRRVLELLI